ncbi:MAG TPA: efflux RND transporter periplasmic adaptor subunit [Pirellulales bacterium]|nr:efflux RND transporter periplasmic adaptor subunit [Pirellulales bacterium]
MACGIAAGAYLAANSGHESSRVDASEGGHSQAAAEGAAERIAVETVKPTQGSIERTTTQPASVQAFMRSQLFSKVSGYMKMTRDIGEEVEKDDVVALVDMPELEKEVQHDKAAVVQANAQVKQMEAHIQTAEADYEAAEALIGEREADLEHAIATLEYRTKVFERIKDLVQQKGLEQRLADEAEDNWAAAKAGRSAARAAVVSAKAQANAAKARIARARADLEDAKAKVEVSEATLQKDQVFLDYATIRAPFKAVITVRNFQVGDFINARDQGASLPMLAVDEVDLMRVVVQVPDKDVPFADVDDPVTVVIDSLPGKKFPGKIARVANSEDPDTRTMRVEIDLPNDRGLLRDGMYGYATILLDQGSKSKDTLTVPSASLHIGGDGEGGGKPAGKGGKGGHAKHESKYYLWVVREGKAEKVHVDVGAENGIVTEILSGLRPNDEVVVYAKQALVNGTLVSASSAQ